jgi:hypothetical protein
VADDRVQRVLGRAAQSLLDNSGRLLGIAALVLPSPSTADAPALVVLSQPEFRATGRRALRDYPRETSGL